jgi:hypothetical protein
MVGGRVTAAPGSAYLIGCYLTRQQSNGTTSGADYLPTQTSTGDTLPGVSGLIYLYKGYGLQWADVPSDYTAGEEIPSGLDWTSLADGSPDWLVPGMQAVHMQGGEAPKHCVIERITGRYGNVAIDEILIKEVGGIPILVRSGDIVD